MALAQLAGSLHASQFTIDFRWQTEKNSSNQNKKGINQ